MKNEKSKWNWVRQLLVKDSVSKLEQIFHKWSLFFQVWLLSRELLVEPKITLKEDVSHASIKSQRR